MCLCEENGDKKPKIPYVTQLWQLFIVVKDVHKQI